MLESAANTILNRYLREKRLYCYYELKVARGNSFAFSRIEEHQDEGLMSLAYNGLVWKLSDQDSRKKPCDGFCAPPLPAYLVIRFRKSYYLIRYEEIRKLMNDGHRSITEKEALFLAERVFHT